MISSMVTPAKLRLWKNSCLVRPKNPSAAALSGLHPFALIERVRLLDNVRILAHFWIPALMERDMDRAGYDFQSPDNEKPRLERGTEPDPRKSYSSTRPCSRASSTPWCARRSSGSSTRCPTLQADEIANAARYGRSDGRRAYRAGPLRAEPDRQGRQTRAQGPQAEGRGLRVGRDRTLPQARGERRGGADRHVPGRRVHQTGRRHQPIAVGRNACASGRKPSGRARVLF